MDPSSSRHPTIPDLKRDVLDAQVALDRGDLRTVRKKLRRLTDPTIEVPAELSEDVAKLERTVKSDPAAIALAIGCVIFFMIVLFQYVV
jgi:hypothetical protein